MAAFVDRPIALARSSLQNPDIATQTEGATPLHLGVHAKPHQKLLRPPRHPSELHRPFGHDSFRSRLGHEAVAHLAYRDIDVNAGTDRGRITLHQASYIGQEDMVKILLSNPRAKVNTVYGCKMSALGKAVEKGYGGIVTLLLRHLRIQVSRADLEAFRRWVKSPRTKSRCPVTGL